MYTRRPVRVLQRVSAAGTTYSPHAITRRKCIRLLARARPTRTRAYTHTVCVEK